jgi:hypothetical protein
MVQRRQKRRRLKGRRQPGLAAPLDVMKLHSRYRRLRRHDHLLEDRPVADSEFTGVVLALGIGQA